MNFSSGTSLLSARKSIDPPSSQGTEQATGCRRQATPILPARTVQAVADQMHNAGLQRSGRVDHCQRLSHALQPVGDRDQGVSNPAGPEIVEVEFELTRFVEPRSLAGKE